MALSMSSTVTLFFSLLVAIVALTAVATRLRLPYVILLVLGGLALGFVPGLPDVKLDPELVLFLFLPPLIYSSAWLTSWREFRANLRPILLLSVGLVLATTTVVAVVAHGLIGLTWPVAFVLGALASPTDAVAASATAKNLGLPRSIVTVIEAESMVNDATGLVVYRFAVAAVVSGSFSLAQASLQFVLVSAGGLIIGLLVGWPLAWLHRHLDNAPLEIAITLLTPFAAYLLAEALRGVITALAQRSDSRLDGHAWRALPGGGPGPTPHHYGWQPVPGARPGHLFDLLRHSGDPGGARAEPDPLDQTTPPAGGRITRTGTFPGSPGSCTRCPGSSNRIG